MTHGGKRTGAGRKPRANEKTRRVLSLPPHVWRQVEKASGEQPINTYLQGVIMEKLSIKTDFVYTPNDEPRGVTATDLSEEVEQALEANELVESGSIVQIDERGYMETGESGQYVWLPEAGRIGIAWGADASWAYADSGVEEAIDCYLNRPDEYEARA